MIYGIEAYQLWPQEGPFWWLNDMGQPELFSSYEEAVQAVDELYSTPEFIGYSFRAVEYIPYVEIYVPIDQGGER